MTNGEFVSRVINGLNVLNKDQRISRRYILNVGKQKSAFYISQKMADKSLYREDNLYRTLDCFPLEKIEITSCDIIEFRNCNIIMKSKKKLPKLVNAKYGNSLKEVTSIDDLTELKPTTPSQYRRDRQRAGQDDYVRYYVKDGFLYIVDREIYRVNLYLLTLETDKLESLSECKKCSCDSLWDFDFITPDKMEEIVIQETIKEVSLRLQMPVDSNPNLDENIRGKAQP